MENTDPLSEKRIVILGAGRQGTALARFAVSAGAFVILSDLRKAAQLQATVSALDDLPSDRFELVLGKHPKRLLNNADILALSGGVPLDTPLVKEARKRQIPLTNDSLEFMRRAPATVIGITGSAGKTTTTALTGLMSQLFGKRTWIGGNIGKPLLSDIRDIEVDDLVVQELSSFQLELWSNTSPDIAAILNITPNHLDRHITMDRYSEAKANILRWQRASDVAVLSADDPRTVELQPLVKGRLRLFSLIEAVHDGAFVHNDNLWLNNGAGHLRIVSTLKEMHIPGRHNVANVLAAMVLAESAGISDEAIAEAIRTFSGVPHRLEVVRDVDGVQYINDSIATAPERALAALEAFDEPIILLAGGQDKDMVWDDWARRVSQKAKYVILFGKLGTSLSRRLKKDTPKKRVKTLEDAVQLAAEIAEAGDIVLLSPGGTSFDSYSDFVERGEEFRQLVLALPEEPPPEEPEEVEE